MALKDALRHELCYEYIPENLSSANFEAAMPAEIWVL